MYIKERMWVWWILWFFFSVRHLTVWGVDKIQVWVDWQAVHDVDLPPHPPFFKYLYRMDKDILTMGEFPGK